MYSRQFEYNPQRRSAFLVSLRISKDTVLFLNPLHFLSTYDLSMPLTTTKNVPEARWFPWWGGWGESEDPVVSKYMLCYSHCHQSLQNHGECVPPRLCLCILATWASRRLKHGSFDCFKLLESTITELSDISQAYVTYFTFINL